MELSEELIKIGEGASANVYKSGDLSIKIYKNRPLLEELTLKYRITPDVIKILKDIKHDNFIDIKDYTEYQGLITSYTYTYIEESKKRITNLPTEYTIINLKYMDRLASILTNENIIIHDNHSENILFDGNELKIIDPDCYELHPRIVKNLKIYNKEKMLGYIENLYIRELRRTTIDATEKIHEIFKFEIKDNTDLAYELSKKIKCKYPKQML